MLSFNKMPPILILNPWPTSLPSFYTYIFSSYTNTNQDFTLGTGLSFDGLPFKYLTFSYYLTFSKDELIPKLKRSLL